MDFQQAKSGQGTKIWGPERRNVLSLQIFWQLTPEEMLMKATLYKIQPHTIETVTILDKYVHLREDS